MTLDHFKRRRKFIEDALEAFLDAHFSRGINHISPSCLGEIISDDTFLGDNMFCDSQILPPILSVSGHPFISLFPKVAPPSLQLSSHDALYAVLQYPVSLFAVRLLRFI